MRWVAPLVTLLLVGACGQSADTWPIALVDPQGRPMVLPQLQVVLFEPEAAPRIVFRDLGGFPYEDQVKLPALRRGHYELWLPGCRPLRVERRPDGPLRIEYGYPVDVTWRRGVPFAAGASLHIKATWRGSADHPEALLRNSVAAAAPRPGTHSPSWLDFVQGILIDAAAGTGRFYVPWPGAYRVTWGEGRFTISEGPGHFSGSGGGSWSPGDGTAVDVQAEGPAPRVVLPRR